MSRSKHKGVVLIKPQGRHGWRARYRDPDTGRIVKLGIERSLTTAAQREKWAIAKSQELQARRRVVVAAVEVAAPQFVWLGGVEYVIMPRADYDRLLALGEQREHGGAVHR